MKKQIGMLLACILMFQLFTGTLVSFADHDDDYYSEKHEDEKSEKKEHKKDKDKDKKKKSREKETDWDNDDGEYSDSINTEEWNMHEWFFWEREVPVKKGELPINKPMNIRVSLDSKGAKDFWVIPIQGELFVSGKEFGAFLGASTTYYAKSKILTLANEQQELIVRAGSNATFENGSKVPMPAKAMLNETSIYLPISVIANSFGYVIEWNEANNTIDIKLEQ